MSKIYTSAVDHYNTHPYPLMAPTSYTTKPAFIEDDDGYITSFYEEPDPHAKSRTLMPISHMAQMSFLGLTFTIINDNDVLEILHSIDNYLLEVQDELNIPGSPIATYAKSHAYPLRKEVHKVFLRVINRHPYWKDLYTGDSLPLTRIFNKLAGSLPDEGPASAISRVFEEPPGAVQRPVYDNRSLEDKLRDLSPMIEYDV